MNWSRIGLVTSAIGVGHALSQPTPTSSEDMDNISGPEKIGIAVAAVGGAGLAAYGLGSGVMKTGELAWENRDAIAKGVGKAVGRGVSHLAIPAARGAVQAVVGPAVGILDAVSKIAVTEDPVKFKNNIGNLGLTRAGKGIAIAGAIVAGCKGAIDSYNNAKMGQNYGVETSTPQNILYDVRQDLAETYGAGGDLVFALNKNRRG